MYRANILFCRKSFSACGILLLLMLAGLAHSADVYQTKDMPLAATGQPANSWEIATFWSDSQAAHAGDDYFVGRLRDGSSPTGLTAGRWNCRTPNQVDAIFPGASLTIDTSGTLLFKGLGMKSYDFANLKLKGNANFSQGQDNTSCTITGHITLADTPVIAATGTAGRGFVFNCPIDGSGVLTINMDANNKKVIFAGDGGAYNGTMVQNNGNLILNTTKPLGQTRSLTVQGSGKLWAYMDVNCSGTTLSVVSGQVILDHRINFGTVVLGGKKLANGQYQSADLQTSFSAQVSNGGGTLIVGPAPNPVRNSWLFN